MLSGFTTLEKGQKRAGLITTIIYNDVLLKNQESIYLNLKYFIELNWNIATDTNITSSHLKKRTLEQYVKGGIIFLWSQVPSVPLNCSPLYRY